MTYYVGNIECVPYDIKHSGIKGMKLGVRRFQNEDGTLTAAGVERYREAVAKEAARDAKEAATAKMYYGEGAGNRRKLIDAKVKQRSKDPIYRDEYAKAYAKQDMGKRAARAIRQRHTADFANTVDKLPGKIIRIGSAAVTAYSLYKVGKEIFGKGGSSSNTYSQSSHDYHRSSQDAYRNWSRRHGY